jgi:hypothetical protein
MLTKNAPDLGRIKGLKPCPELWAAYREACVAACISPTPAVSACMVTADACKAVKLASLNRDKPERLALKKSKSAYKQITLHMTAKAARQLELLGTVYGFQESEILEILVREVLIPRIKGISWGKEEILSIKQETIS